MNIFVSYSSKNRALVSALANDLEAVGHQVWYDQELTGGQEWWGRICDQIRRCDLFLAALSPEWAESFPSKQEFAYALALHKRFLPVLLADVKIPLLHSALQLVQFVDYRLQDKSQTLSLLKAVNGLPAAQPLPDPLPDEPPPPISPLTQIRDQLEAPTLSADDQLLIVVKLEDFLRERATAQDARALLDKLTARADLFARTDREIRELLARVPSVIPLATLNLQERDLDGHRDSLSHALFSPDGTVIVTASVDMTATVWNAATGESIRKLLGHEDYLTDASFTPDGQYVLTSSADRTARMWEVHTGTEFRRFSGGTSGFSSVAFTPDGKAFLASLANDSVAYLMDVRTGRNIREFVGHSYYVYLAYVSPDGKIAATFGFDHVGKLWDADRAQETAELGGFPGNIYGAAFSPDNHLLATAGQDTVIRIWEVATGKELRQMNGHSESVLDIAYSPDGKILATSSEDHTVRLWDADTGAEMGKIMETEEFGALNTVMFSPDGQFVLIGTEKGTALLRKAAVQAKQESIGN